ncbi:uncharacterized protein LOC113312350 [Papaver somniferum]|uniref:uncharacterized protein LOC113312350 n=1 Tax=Papaver somniferum TaxID=3469 RepID=UPI000E6FF2DD|nr:uncharacterized protein LOC113312350 [Papaver somniferum]
MRLSQAMQDIETHCEVCKQEHEDLFHILISCSHAQAVWSSLNINIAQIIKQCQSVKEWIISWSQDIHNAGSESIDIWRKLLMVGSWVIWKERCDCVFQDKKLIPSRTVERIQNQLISYNSTTKETSPVDSADILTPTSASPEHITNTFTCLQDILNEVTTFKFFVDISYDKYTTDCGYGIVCYDTAGTLVGFKGSYAAGIIDSKAGECKVVLEGLRWAKAMDLDNVHIISDAEAVVNSINNIFFQ